jgi:uncharacterized protein YdaU (DUF1376 family)
MTAPAFQFYPSDDFLADTKVLRMSASEKGIYMMLYCVCWIDGELPLETKELARLALVSHDEMEQAWPTISRCFVIAGDTLRHPKLDDKRGKQSDFRARQVENGKKGGRPKKGWVNLAFEKETQNNPGLSVEKPRKSSPTPTPTPTPTPEEHTHALYVCADEQDPKWSKARAVRFFEDRFWPAVWFKTGKDGARRAWLSRILSLEDAELAAEAAITQGPVILARARNGGITPIHPATWINAGALPR